MSKAPTVASEVIPTGAALLVTRQNDVVVEIVASTSNPSKLYIYACAGRIRRFLSSLLGQIAELKSSRLS